MFSPIKHAFRRSPSAFLLNLLGLSVAFASFLIIMMQVDYDYSFNRCVPHHERIYQVYRGEDTYFCRGLADRMDSCSVHIEASSLMGLFPTEATFTVGEHDFKQDVWLGFTSYLKLFSPQMVVGSVDDLVEGNHILLSESVARRLFGHTDVVGQRLNMGKTAGQAADAMSCVVVGVCRDFAANSLFPSMAWARYYDHAAVKDFTNYNYAYYLRLDSSDNLPLVEQALNDVMKKYAEESGREQTPVHLVPLAETHLKEMGDSASSGRTTMYLLLCISVVIIVVAAINFMNFALAEAPMRLRAINTRKVLGQPVWQLRTELLAESVGITLLAYLLALLWAYLAADTPLQELVQAPLALRYHYGLLLSLLVIALLTGLLAGLYPSWYVTSFPPALVLKGSYGLSPRGKALRTGLVCLQFAVAFVLILCVGVMFLQSRFIRTADYGYNRTQVLAARCPNRTLNKQGDAIRAELLKLSGVEEVALSNFIIGTGDGYMGWGRNDNDHSMNFSCLPVDWNYLRALGIRVTEGRDFNQHDGDVYIFNQAARKQYDWMELDKPILNGNYPVVGFCEDVKFCSMRVDNTQMPMAFFVMGKDHEGWGWRQCINVRVSAGADHFAMPRQLEECVRRVAGDVEVEFHFLDQTFEQTYQDELRFIRQMQLFSLLAILISIIGVFGLTMYESEYRRKEIGLRKIMGSTTREVLLMFNRRYLLMLLASFVVAAPVGWALGTHWLQGFAERTAIPWWLFLLALLLVAVVTILTVTYRTWKNANENPIHCIKTE